MNLWTNLSNHEKQLIAILSVLLVIVIAWFFGIKPLYSAKNSVDRQYQTALRDYNILQRNAPQLSAQNLRLNSGQNQFDRNAVLTVARVENISISRMQPAPNEALQVWFDDVSSAQVYNFLQNLSRSYAVEVSRAQINRRKDGLISAQFTFASLS